MLNFLTIFWQTCLEFVWQEVMLILGYFTSIGISRRSCILKLGALCWPNFISCVLLFFGFRFPQLYTTSLYSLLPASFSLPVPCLQPSLCSPMKMSPPARVSLYSLTLAYLDVPLPCSLPFFHSPAHEPPLAHLHVPLPCL